MFGAVQGLVLTVLFVAFLVVKVWALADCATRPHDAFPAAGKRSKIFWLALNGVAVLTALITSPMGVFGLAGIVVAAVYLLDVRPKVSEVTSWRS